MPKTGLTPLAAFRIETAKAKILIDPFLTYNQPFAAYFEKGGHFRRASFPGTKGDDDKMSMSTSSTANGCSVV